VAMTVAVESIDRAAAWLAEAGLDARRWGDHLALPARHCLGLGLELAQK